MQSLTSQMHEMQEQMNSMNDSEEFQEVESNHTEKLYYVPCQPAAIPSSRSMLSRNKRLPLDTWKTCGLQENVFGKQFSTIDASRNHYQRIHHSMTPGASGSVAVHIGTGTPAARDEDLNRSTIPMPTIARRPSTISSLNPVDILRNFLVGQQRLQISELQFEKFLTPFTFSCWKIRFKSRITTGSDFPSEAMLWIKRSRDGRFIGWIEVLAITQVQGFPKFWDAGREDCLCFEQDHPKFSLQEGHSRGTESPDRGPVSTVKTDRLHDPRLFSSYLCSWYRFWFFGLILCHSSRW